MGLKGAFAGFSSAFLFAKKEKQVDNPSQGA
jgi:hypothetical protein